MRWILTPLILSAVLAPAVSQAKPSIIASDIDTGIILSSNNIDAKQDPYVTGKLALIFIALNDIMTGDLDPIEDVTYPDGVSLPLAVALKDAASDSLSSPVSITLIAAKIAQSPAILDERTNALFRKVGMRGTRIETIRTRIGEPSWSGFTTSRDIARLVSSLVLTHEQSARALLPLDAVGFPDQGDANWIYRDGMCLSLALAPMTKRRIVSVIQGASSEDNCRGAADVAIRHNDSRITQVTRNASP